MITCTTDFGKKLARSLKHKLLVEQYCIDLADKLLALGEEEVARELIVNGFKHDLSKFEGEEFDILGDVDADKDEVRRVAKKHAKSKKNKHHPEAWGSIHRMPRVYLAEMACDLKARSTEFGTDVRTYIANEATVRYKFKVGDRVYNDLMFFLDLICEKPFTPITEPAASNGRATH